MIHLRGMSICTEPLRFRLPHAEGRRDRGFTLIELVVTIAIIVLLVSLLVYASVALMQRSEVTRTQNTLKLLVSAEQEWELEAGRQVSFRSYYDNPAPGFTVNFDVVSPTGSAEGEARDFTDRLVEIVARSESVKPIIAQIDSNRMKRDATTGRLQFFDEWDRQILAIPPGRRPMPEMPTAFPVDPDGSIRIISLENAFGIAKNHSMYFLSAGPDGKYGDLHLDVAQASLSTDDLNDIALAADNIYSDEPGKDRL